MIVGGYSATGPREVNEDNFYIKDFSDVNSFSNGVKAFIMVSDGMGGYQGGDVASGLAVACAKSYLDQLLELAQTNQLDLDASAALREISSNAHEAIVAESQTRGNTVMGATFVGAFVSDNHAWIGHVGDSRAYLVRAGEATQLTEDHSHVGRLLSRGVITEEEAQNHPERNKIERALGFTAGDCDINEVELQQNDALLLCSDGVYTTVRVDGLAQCVKGASSATSAAERAVKRALDNGTDDNSTAVVLYNCDQMPREKRRRGRQATLTGMEATKVRNAAMPAPDGSEARPEGNPYLKPYSRRTGRRNLGDRVGLKNILIPVCLAVVLIGVSVVLALRACSDQSTPVEEAPTSNGATATSTTTTTTQDESGNSASDKSTSTGTSTERMNFQEQEIPQGEDLEIKYVDESGLAQRFTYDFALEAYQLAYLHQGSLVSVSQEVNAYGRSKRYLTLAPAYLRMLREDVQLAAGGATTFSSELAGLAGQERYQQFVTALAQHVDELESIAYLVIDEFPTKAAVATVESQAPAASGEGQVREPAQDDMQTSDAPLMRG